MSLHKYSWKNWQPGLNNGDYTLKEMFDSLPGHDDTDISFHVKLFENPQSPFALKGAIDLAPHDCIHILLGRGLFNQDEGFVIGFTMGTNNLPVWQYTLFQWVTQYLYKSPFKFNKNAIQSYRLGVAYGQKIRRRGKCKDIQDMNLMSDEYLGLTITEIRKRLGIDVKELRAIYRKEKLLIPNTKASRRLPVDKSITMTRINDVEGKHCDWYDN